MAMAPVNLDHHFCDYNTFSLIEIRYAIVVCLQSCRENSLHLQNLIKSAVTEIEISHSIAIKCYLNERRKV